MPDGPVTHSKAWVEMVHRYLASGVGLLIFALALGAWWLWKKASPQDKTKLLHPGWAALTFVWVCIQGAFGALTVTMKLFPAIVALHLLGGYILLALLTGQSVALSLRDRAEPAFSIPSGLRLLMASALGVLVLQVLSGAWVSTNYAVLACTDFPMCQGQWFGSSGFILETARLCCTSQTRTLAFGSVVASSGHGTQQRRARLAFVGRGTAHRWRRRSGRVLGLAACG
jgi:cytochrome c oxidase assembly protein subunit 15